jgi:mono/diheme cytochrome c family protein
MAQKNAPFRQIGMLLCISLASLGFCSSIMARQEAPKGTTASADSMKQALEAKTISLVDSRCAGCHGGRKPRMGLSLEPERLIEAVADVRSRQIDSLKLVDTRMPERSYLLMKVRDDKGIKGSRMPDNAPALSAGEIKTIDLWILSISEFRRGSRTAPSAADSTRKQ